jgi:hypothetical protein
MSRDRWISALFCLAALSGCNRATDIDEVPIGAEVQVTRQDGGLVEGTLEEAGATTVKVDTGRVSRTVEKQQIAEVRVVTDQLRDEPPPRATFREVTLPADTKVGIRLASDVSSEASRVEDAVEGEIVDDIVVDDAVVVPAGSRVRGAVLRAEPSGKVKGRASLALRFTQLVLDGATYPISAEFARTAPSAAASDAKKIGVPAIGGAVIGGIIGGKKGAAIGAAAGGGAGAAVVLTTPGEPVRLASGTQLSLSLGRPVDVRVKLD